MAAIYANLIKNNLKTLDQVPIKDPNLRIDVIKVLKADVSNGKITAEDFEKYTGLTYETTV